VGGVGGYAGEVTFESLHMAGEMFMGLALVQRQVDGYDGRYPCRVTGVGFGQNNNPVGEQCGFLNVVGNKNNGSVGTLT